MNLITECIPTYLDTHVLYAVRTVCAADTSCCMAEGFGMFVHLFIKYSHQRISGRMKQKGVNEQKAEREYPNNIVLQSPQDVCWHLDKAQKNTFWHWCLSNSRAILFSISNNRTLNQQPPAGKRWRILIMLSYGAVGAKRWKLYRKGQTHSPSTINQNVSSVQEWGTASSGLARLDSLGRSWQGRRQQHSQSCGWVNHYGNLWFLQKEVLVWRK